MLLIPRTHYCSDTGVFPLGSTRSSLYSLHAICFCCQGLLEQPFNWDDAFQPVSPKNKSFVLNQRLLEQPFNWDDAFQPVSPKYKSFVLNRAAIIQSVSLKQRPLGSKGIVHAEVHVPEGILLLHLLLLAKVVGLYKHDGVSFVVVDRRRIRRASGLRMSSVRARRKM